MESSYYYKTISKKDEVGRQGSVDSLKFTPDGKYIVCASKKHVEIWNIESGSQIKKIKATLVTLPIVIPPRILSKALSFWYGYIIIYLIFSILLMIFFYGYFIYFHVYSQLYSLIIFILIIFLNFYLNYRIIKDIKAGTPSDAPLPDLLKTFLKPQKITEEEVSISKEKKVCLVCKNKVGGINFICKNCETFYCQKC